MHLIRFFYSQILFDFGILFESVSQSALEDRWDDIVKKFHILFNVDVPKDIIPVPNVDLINFIGLLKRFSVIRTSIKTSTASILTFSKVCAFILKFLFAQIVS